MQYRHEWKHEISAFDVLCLRRRLSAVMAPDPTPPAGDAGAVLEVKWDEYLPDVIRDLVQTPSTRSAAFSKYAACRVYG